MSNTKVKEAENEVLKEIKNGKKVRRKNWFDDNYIDRDTPLNCLMEAYLLANDWEVVE